MRDDPAPSPTAAGHVAANGSVHSPGGREILVPHGVVLPVGGVGSPRRAQGVVRLDVELRGSVGGRLEGRLLVSEGTILRNEGLQFKVTSTEVTWHKYKYKLLRLKYKSLRHKYKSLRHKHKSLRHKHKSLWHKSLWHKYSITA